MAVCAIAECLGTYLGEHYMGSGLHYVLTFTEFCVTPFIPVFMSYACGITGPARIVGGIGVVHILIEAVMVSFGGIYYITPDGIYHRGSFYFIYVIVYLISYFYNLALVIIINRNYKSKDIGTVTAINITVLAGLVPSILDGSIKTAYLCVSQLVIFVYIYFQSLYEQDMQSKIAEHNESMNRELIRTLSYTLEAKDVYTKGHSMRVAEYARLLAVEAGFDDEAADRLHFAATLHDIGKIGVPDTVLNKPGRLTDREYDVIKMHTTIGDGILKNIDTIRYAGVIARHHHERYDGNGYPDGLKGEDIPFEARIVAIADTYDAMTSKRVYRQKTLSDSVIREEFEKNKGRQFDPKLAELFLKLFDEGKMEPIISSNIIALSNGETVDMSMVRDNLFKALGAYGQVGENEIPAIDAVCEIIGKIAESTGNTGIVGNFKTEFPEMGKLYGYFEEVCRQKNYHCFIVIMTISPDNGAVVMPGDLDIAMEAFDIAVRQTIGDANASTGLGSGRYLIVLADPDEDAVRDTMERSINYYYKIQGRTAFEPKYEIRRVIAPQNDKAEK